MKQAAILRSAPLGVAVLLALAAPPLTHGWLAVGLSLAGVGVWTWLLGQAASDRGAFALSGFAVAGASLLILHWVPAAASPYLGVWGGGMAWLSVVLLHGAAGGAVGMVVYRLRDILPFPVLAGAGWGILEWMPGALPVVGIPWPGIAWSLLDTPLASGLAVFGASGMGVFAAAAWGGGIGSRSRQARIAWGVAPLALWLIAPWLLPEPSRRSASPEDGGQIRATLTWERDRALLGDEPATRASVAEFLEAVLPALPEGVPTLWPEAPLTGVVGEDPDVLAYLQVVQQAGENTGGAGAVAGIHARVGGRQFNTLVRTGTRDEAPEGVHRKRFLVPGVERTHLSGAGRPADAQRSGRGLAPGAGALPFTWGDRDVGALLCFEILHAGETARLRRRGSTLLLQATHDTMLSEAGRRQHEAMVRVRAAEFRIPVLRAALGGEGMGIGADGRRLEPVASAPVLNPAGNRLGRVDTFDLPSVAPTPPSAWVVPLTGPLALAVLLFPLFADWRRRQLKR